MSRLLLACLSLLAAAPACRRSEAAAAGGPPAAAKAAPQLASPERVRHVPLIEATGTLRARAQAQLAFVLAGTLERIAAKRGEVVAQGAPILLLDAAAARAQAAQAEAAVGMARAQLALADDALRRAEAIRRDQGGISEAQLVQARLQRDLAAAQLRSAEAVRDQAKVTLERHVLRAPFAGVVTRVPDGVGLAVSAGVPVAAVESSRQLVLDTSLTQAEAAQVRVGSPVEVTVTATGARTEQARIAVVLPTVDPATNRVPVEIDVPNRDARFFAHASARASLAAGPARDALRVPSASVVQRAGAFALWTAGRDGRVQALPVDLLAQEHDAAVVAPTRPWPDGARVVAAPPLGIAEGQVLAEAAAP